MSRFYCYRNCSFKDIKAGSWQILRSDDAKCCICGSYHGTVYEFNDYTTVILLREMNKYGLCWCEYIEIGYQRYACGDFSLVCEREDEYKEIFYFKKGDKKYPIIDKENNFYTWHGHIISDLKPNTKYHINKFEKTKYGNIVLSSLDGVYHPIYVNNKVINILEKYFKCNNNYDNNEIYCTYNNKKEKVNLTLITEDEIITDNGMKVLHQKLCLDLSIGSYTFYINKVKFIDYKKEGRYNFLAMHIYNNNSSYDNNMILGYEFKEKEYYYLKFEEKLILKNIDKDIAKNFEEMKRQDLYTYLLSNNEKRGMTINIDKDHNITYRLVWLNDDFFKSISTLDISLLKSQIVSEPCEINHFNGEVEDFDYKD